jgi:hypothetical protein
VAARLRDRLQVEAAMAKRKRKRQSAEDMAAAHGMEYLRTVPDAVPAGRVVVHNRVRPAAVLGERGFRAWLQAPDADKLEECDCGWAPRLGTHYRVRGVGVSVH